MVKFKSLRKGDLQTNEAAKFATSADFKISPSGRKIHKREKIGDLVKDIDKEEQRNEQAICSICECAPCVCDDSHGLVSEAIDKENNRLIQLARLGLVDTSDVSKLRIAIDQLKSDKTLTINQRTLLLNVMLDLVKLVTGDDTIFQRAKSTIQKEDTSISKVKYLTKLALASTSANK